MTTARTMPTAPPDSGGGRRHHPGVALAVIVTCQLMVVLDASIVTVALPKIQSALHFSTTGLAWVQNAYMLTFGGLLLLGGRAGDILGRRRTFVAGLILFTAASLLGGFATSGAWLVAARTAQGVGGAIAAPSALALIVANFPTGRERTKALSVFSAASAAGGSLGLILGGMLTAWASWRWVMFVNVPIGIVIAFLAPRFIAEPQRHPGRFDSAGALTVTLGLGSLVYAFIRVPTSGWSDATSIGGFVLAAVLFAAFIMIEVRAKQPLVPLRLLADRNRSAAYLNMLVLPAGMFGMFFFLTQFLQDVLGFSALKAGCAFLPMTIGLFGVTRVMPRLIARFGPKPLLITGSTMVLIGMVWLTQISATTSFTGGILGPMLIFGIGAGLGFMPLSVVILSGVEPHESGAASGLLQTMQQIGGCLGLAVLVSVFGTASKHAARHPGWSPRLQADYAMAHGISSGFIVGTIFVGVALLVALVAIRTDR
jgi:EmrB/QacA subfamily drug resistance transporter